LGVILDPVNTLLEFGFTLELGADFLLAEAHQGVFVPQEHAHLLAEGEVVEEFLVLLLNGEVLVGLVGVYVDFLNEGFVDDAVGVEFLKPLEDEAVDEEEETRDTGH